MEAGEEGKGEGGGGGGDEGKGGWLGAASVSSLLKHSCLLCWSPRDKDFVEQDECVARKTGEIRVRPHVSYYIPTVCACVCGRVCVSACLSVHVCVRVCVHSHVSLPTVRCMCYVRA